jgi:diaminopropionate ammonia-lyase
MHPATWIKNQFKTDDVPKKVLESFSKNEINQAYQFHSSMPGYNATPLHSLETLSKSLGVKKVYVKDESKRFGLNAFKGLGASYAMASYFAEKLSIDLATTDFRSLMEQVKELPKYTVATVTAGNHGKGVAWAADLFNQRAKVFLPKGSSQSRLEAIQDLGADASISSLNYDDTVQKTAKLAEENDWVLMQDTAWEGYERIPFSIMQGYTTIVAEILDQLNEQILDQVTHVFLQAGVGSFAGAVAAAIYNAASGTKPKVILVEPTEAACIYQSAEDPSGEAQRVYGNLSTMMAGLACGEPSPIGWNVLKSTSDYIFTCDDAVSAKGMRLYGNPLGDDHRIIAGESGAVTVGLLHEIMTNEQLIEAREEIGLDESSTVLLINTEGDTDPVNYKKIVG